MSKQLYTQLLSEFGKVLGIEGLCANEDGHCLLVFDESIEVHIQYNEPADEITLFSCIGSYDEISPSSALFERLLSANLFWQYTSGATLSVDSQEKKIFLARRLILSGMDLFRFENLLEGFVNAAEYAIQRILTESVSTALPEDTSGESYAQGIKP